jgi:hypothetical protein
VRPPVRKRTNNRAAVLSALLLLLACTVSAGASSPMSQGDLQSTVDVVLTANAPAVGTELPPGELETAVYDAVVQTLQASGSPEAGTPPPAASEGGPTASAQVLLIFPTSGPTTTLTVSTGVTASRTTAPTASRTATPRLSATPAGPTLTSPPPSPTSPGPTLTSPPPSPTLTASPVPPTNTAVPPTDTVPPRTNTPPPPVCAWDVSVVSIHGDTVSVVIHNTGDLTLHVVGVGINWTGHDDLVRVRLDGTIWSGRDNGPTFTVGTSKTIGAGSSRTLEFEFAGHRFIGSASVSVDADC